MARKRKAKKTYTPSQLKKMAQNSTYKSSKLRRPAAKPVGHTMSSDIIPGPKPKTRRVTTGSHSSGTHVPKQKEVSAKASPGGGARKTKRIGKGSGRAVLPQAAKKKAAIKGAYGTASKKTAAGGGRKKVSPKTKRTRKPKPLSPRRKK